MSIKKVTYGLASIIFSLGLISCSGGGGSSSSASGGQGLSASGFKVPTEISAVPTNAVVGLNKVGLRSHIAALLASDPDTDYSNAVTVKYVEENALEQFEIIEQVMNAMAQTRYADADNINNGPYRAMVAWQDERNGIETKVLEPWVVDSQMLLENGVEVNRVQAWIEEEDMGMTRIIKAEVKIYASANQNADGSDRDYGVWKMNVKFDDLAISFFAAEASVGPNGESILKIHENFDEGLFLYEVKAILNKSETVGFGKVSYPDWSSCMDPNCVPGVAASKYAYNADYLAVQRGGNPVEYKNRNAVTELTHHYGMFDSATGDDVMRSKAFGFPLRYTDNGAERWAYYGAWQGRHQIWADGNTLPAGTVVTRGDRGPNQTPETYTASEPFLGTLSKRSLVAGDINDLKNIPVETWVNIFFNLQYDGTQWIDCKNPDYSVFPPTCGAGSGPYTDFASLVMNPNDYRKWVGIHGWDNVNQVPVEYLYDPNGGSGAGFYIATFDMNTGMLVNTGTLYTPVADEELWVDIGGSIYIEYTATGTTGWVEKTLLDFDELTWTPVFDPNGDIDYTLPLDREYYINNQGANYVVKRTGANLYDVKIELQSVANPVNAAGFVAAGTVFKLPWEDPGNSTYEFITDAADATRFLKLVYKTIGANDSNSGLSVGDVVTIGLWGLEAYVSDVSTGVQYNWEYPREGETWGILQYLLDSGGGYLLLDDPIQLDPITVTNNAGEVRTLSLQYDGWMHGLPNLYEELRKNDYVMSAEIADKIINIPEGTEVTDALDSTQTYLLKPLEVSQFLAGAADPGTLDITLADAVDLATVPNFVEHNMGAMPVVDGVKYSEGVLVQ